MIGELIGSYRITAKLGEGGMGAVYLGEHQFIARKAAIKVLLPEVSANKEIVQRFFNEARATAVIRHPGIVEIVDCAVLPNGSAYIVMELLVGQSLGSVLNQAGRLPVQRAVHLARHIADALAAAHDQRIVHRDLKPDNVFVLSAAGAPSPIKILDFGIAKLLNPEPSPSRHKTRTGSIMGTPVYMSPEQCRGTGDIDHRTDIYSLGCILFEMLCGRPPFTQEGFGELIHCHLSVVPPPIRSIDPTLPGAVDALVARMLAKSPADRPQTMPALIGELDAATASTGPLAGATTAEIPLQSPAASPVGGTLLLPPVGRASAPTTLRSASGERAAFVGPESELVIAGRRRRSVVAAVVAIAAVGGGVGLWRIGAKEPAGSHGGGANASGVVDGAIARGEGIGVVVGGSTAGAATGTGGHVGASAGKAADEAATETPDRGTGGPTVAIVPSVVPTHPPTLRTIKIMISSQPSGADVCLAKDRVLLGRTKFDWKTEKKPGTAKLLLRKHGYRGEEITVNLEHEAKKVVTLDKLGPDDLDDSDTCEKR